MKVLSKAVLDIKFVLKRKCRPTNSMREKQHFRKHSKTKRAATQF